MWRTLKEIHWNKLFNEIIISTYVVFSIFSSFILVEIEHFLNYILPNLFSIFLDTPFFKRMIGFAAFYLPLVATMTA